MPRRARVVVVGHPHHITQRGNFGMVVFQSDEERQRYVMRLAECVERYGVCIWAWCLMPNHVHFIAVPTRPESFAKAFNVAHMRYTQWLNACRDRRGRLWQDRFYSCVLDESHLLAAVRYVEQNPVRARLAARATEYAWSSARAHVAGVPDPLLRGDAQLREMIADWAAYLGQEAGGEWRQEFRLATRTGRPLGDEGFVGQVEAMLGRTVRRARAGRPKKAKSGDSPHISSVSNE